MNRYGYLRRIRAGAAERGAESPAERVRLAELRGLWGRSPFTALDFETTGLDARTDRICEIGAVRLSDSGVETAVFDLLVHPGRPISPEASRVSGITDDMVRDARPVDEVLPELLSFLGDSIVAAHNASFDMGFLRAAAARLGLAEIRNRVADTRDLAREAFPGLPSYALQNLARSFGLDPGSAHRACDDARTCARLLALCAQTGNRALPDAAASGQSSTILVERKPDGGT